MFGPVVNTTQIFQPDSKSYSLLRAFYLVPALLLCILFARNHGKITLTTAITPTFTLANISSGILTVTQWRYKVSSQTGKSLIQIWMQLVVNIHEEFNLKWIFQQLTTIKNILKILMIKSIIDFPGDCVRMFKRINFK